MLLYSHFEVLYFKNFRGEPQGQEAKKLYPHHMPVKVLCHTDHIIQVRRTIADGHCDITDNSSCSFYRLF